MNSGRTCSVTYHPLLCLYTQALIQKKQKKQSASSDRRMEEREAVSEQSEGSSIYQDPAFLVFRQNNGRYSADYSLKANTNTKKKKKKGQMFNSQIDNTLHQSKYCDLKIKYLHVLT